MQLIPAVDLKDGRCVRLVQGRVDAETVYAADPVAMAQRWVERGAEWLHVVDLDGAVGGEPRHFPIIERIVKSISVPVQVGGGIRTVELIERYLRVGVARVIISTLAIEQPGSTAEMCRRFPGQIAVSVDARDGKVALRGWQEGTALDYLDVARQVETYQPTALIFTAIQRDGTLEGPDLPRLKQLLDTVSLPVIVAGGIGRIEDIRELLPLRKDGLMGIIVGKALYDGAIDFHEALALARSV